MPKPNFTTSSTTSASAMPCPTMEIAARQSACCRRFGLCSRSENPRPMTQSTADSLPPLGAPRVLLVDDDEVNLLLTSMALRERGFDITEATGGDQALGLLVDWTPDIVVLDAQMPGLDGFDTCRSLRALPGFEHVPVLMLTGLDDDASIARAYQAGATDFFVKATQWGLLTERLDFLLRSSRTRIELERSKTRLARACQGADIVVHGACARCEAAA